MTFKTEFPDFPEADMPPIPEGFIDSSWHNDSCPCYWNEAKGLTIFIDYVDHAKREVPELGVRFYLIDTDAVDVASSDDWDVILAAIGAR